MDLFSQAVREPSEVLFSEILLFQNGAILHWGTRQRSIAPETGEYDLDQSALTKNEKR
jgi:hypothetical protein